jgi:hypothetical protein
MVIATIASKEYNWRPEIIEGDDPKVFEPSYIILPAPKPEVGSFKSSFAYLPSAGIWAERTESDDELLEELGGGWQGFATEQ